jgi:hypothetical protein
MPPPRPLASIDWGLPARSRADGRRSKVDSGVAVNRKVPAGSVCEHECDGNDSRHERHARDHQHSTQTQTQTQTGRFSGEGEPTSPRRGSDDPLEAVTATSGMRRLPQIPGVVRIQAAQCVRLECGRQTWNPDPNGS